MENQEHQQQQPAPRLVTQNFPPKILNLISHGPVPKNQIRKLSRKELTCILFMNRVETKSDEAKPFLVEKVVNLLRQRRPGPNAGHDQGLNGQPDAEVPNRQCCICMNAAPSFIYMNCMHFGVCGECRFQIAQGLEPIMENGIFVMRTHCPVCRRQHKIEEVKRIFVI